MKTKIIITTVIAFLSISLNVNNALGVEDTISSVPLQAHLNAVNKVLLNLNYSLAGEKLNLIIAGSGKVKDQSNACITFDCTMLLNNVTFQIISKNKLHPAVKNCQLLASESLRTGAPLIIEGFRHRRINNQFFIFNLDSGAGVKCRTGNMIFNK